MRMCVLQHSDGTPPGTLLQWAESRGYSHQIFRLHRGDKPPAIAGFDCIAILGGPVNVDETEKFPWLIDEKRFIREAIALKKICIGLCLGGQLLAEALGAKVGPNKHWEVGWYKIRFSDGGDLMAFHWHQEIFDLPKGAEKIASSEATPVQAFRYQDFVFATQFHPETTREWVIECAEDSDQPCGPFVQAPQEMLNGFAFVEPQRKWFFAQLDKLTSRPSA